jgi:hypothetical protein
VGRGQRTPPWFPILTAAAVLWGVAAAWRRAWLSDDAYISFRYAENLANGLGLVFNRGERVEGYSNFLWTVWTTLGMKLGVGPESWSVFWGLACYAASILLLALIARRLAGGTPGAVAAMRDPGACRSPHPPACRVAGRTAGSRRAPRAGAYPCRRRESARGTRSR